MFEHQDKLGNPRAHSLFDRITVRRKPVAAGARPCAQYERPVDDAHLPAQLMLLRRLG